MKISLRQDDVKSAVEGARAFFTCVVPLAVVISLVILALVWPMLTR